MNELLQERREYSSNKLQELKSNLTKAQSLLGDKGCIYVTGSFARGEASEFSDLDAFILSLPTELAQSEVEENKKVSNLDEICIKADLIDAIQKMYLPKFSGDGEYLQLHTIHSLNKHLGTPQDDALNTFTARLLLLLESKPLFGEKVYSVGIRTVIDQYWRDYPENQTEFVPGFLVNDILRLWRTFCVNYELGAASTPEESRARRKLKNYKLKHSRMLTCYSAVAYLLQLFKDRGTVSQEAAIEMTKLTPTERLQSIASMSQDSAISSIVVKILDLYERFLEFTADNKPNMVGKFMNKTMTAPYTDYAKQFGNAIHKMLEEIGRGNFMYRVIVV